MSHKIFSDFLWVINKHNLNEEVVITGSWAVYFLTGQVEALKEDTDLDIFVTKKFLDKLGDLKKDFKKKGYLQKYTFHEFSWVMKKNDDYGFQFMLDKKEDLPKGNINLRPGHIKDFYSLFRQDKVKAKIQILGEAMEFFYAGLDSTLITRLLYYKNCLNPQEERIENHLMHLNRQEELTRFLLLKFGEKKLKRLIEDSEYRNLKVNFENILREPVIFKSKYDEIFFEFCMPNKFLNRGKLIILLDGFPSFPKSQILMKEFSRRGYAVLFPRYSGCYESEGRFLKEDPSRAIFELVKYIKEGGKFNEFFGGKEFSLKFEEANIYLLGSSFGSFIGIKLLQNFFNMKGILISPLLSFKKFYPNFKENFKVLKFIKNGFKNVIRMNDGGFNELIQDKFINTSKFNNNCLLIHGKKDLNCINQLKIIKSICGGKVLCFEGGHLSLRDAEKENIKKEIFSWIEKN